MGVLSSGSLRVAWWRRAAPLLFLVACSAPPPIVARGPLAPAAPPVTTLTPPPATALWIEGEGLAPAVDLAFSADHAALFVERKDGSVEAWDAVKGTLLGRGSGAESQSGPLRGNPFSKPAALPPPLRSAGPFFLRSLDGVDDAKLVAWLKTKKIGVEPAPKGLLLTSQGGASLDASPDGRLVVVTMDGSLEVAHRVAHTHFAVKGWSVGYSSHFGYAGDNTTWPGDVRASFGPLPDQLALQSVAARGATLAFGSTRLYDARRGTLTAELAADTCQPNALVWSPHGKYLVREECQGATLLIADAATGAPLPSIPGSMPVAFGADDAVVASSSGGGAVVRRLGDAGSSFVVPGPRGVLATAIAPGGDHAVLLTGDGLDVWDLKAGTESHVDALVLRYPDLTSSATGRFQGYVDDAGPYGLTIVDVTTGSKRSMPSTTAFHPLRDLAAREDAAGIGIVDLASGDALGPPVPVSTGKKKIGVQRLAFSPDGAWLVAQLVDASLVVLDGQGHLARRIPVLDPEGCSPTPMQFVAPDTVSLSCITSIHTVSLTSGKALPEPLWKDLITQASGAHPPFAPPPIAAALAKLPVRYGGPPWSATPSLLVARLDPPLLARAKDGRFVSLHAFAYGTGRAVIVVDDAGRWDANPLGATLVHVSTGGVDDEDARARRKIPGLLAAFVRGE